MFSVRSANNAEIDELLPIYNDKAMWDGISIYFERDF
jgi:hypothetical protein